MSASTIGTEPPKGSAQQRSTSGSNFQSKSNIFPFNRLFFLTMGQASHSAALVFRQGPPAYGIMYGR
jgi:hypothetical protein